MDGDGVLTVVDLTAIVEIMASRVMFISLRRRPESSIISTF